MLFSANCQLELPGDQLYDLCMHMMMLRDCAVRIGFPISKCHSPCMHKSAVEPFEDLTFREGVIVCSVVFHGPKVVGIRETGEAG